VAGINVIAAKFAGRARNSSGLEHLPRCRNILRRRLVFSHIARAAQNSGQLGGDPYHGHAPESAWSASARMHSPATILSKLSNRKAKSEHSTLREYQHNNGAQIRNADDIH
jgi:hypothetical protein